MTSCHVCGLLLRVPAAGKAHCPRCHSTVHMRNKASSLNTTWALLLTAIIAYVPANLYPVMTVVSLGKSQSDTIISGVIYLLLHGD